MVERPVCLAGSHTKFSSTGRYAFSGFLTLQKLVDSFITSVAHADSVVESDSQWVEKVSMCANETMLASFISVDKTGLISSFAESNFPPESRCPFRTRFVPFPVRSYRKEVFIALMKQLFALLFILAYLYPVATLVRGIVHEKEAKIKEGMMMMGLEDGPFYLSWCASSPAFPPS